MILIRAFEWFFQEGKEKPGNESELNPALTNTRIDTKSTCVSFGVTTLGVEIFREASQGPTGADMDTGDSDGQSDLNTAQNSSVSVDISILETFEDKHEFLQNNMGAVCATVGQQFLQRNNGADYAKVDNTGGQKCVTPQRPARGAGRTAEAALVSAGMDTDEVDYNDSDEGTDMGADMRADKNVYEGVDKGVYEGADEGNDMGADMRADKGVYEGADKGVYEGANKGVYEGDDKDVYEGADKGVYEGADKGVYEGADKDVYEGADKGVYEGADKGVYEGADKGIREWESHDSE
jgi:hypothetical protein